MLFQSTNSADLGPKPGVINIRQKALTNHDFRRAIWTGKHLQITVMSIPASGEIGVEMHDNLDQFIKVEQGCAAVYMGETENDLKLVGNINQNYAIVIPAGTWHNVVNTCACPLKVYSVYAPPQHPFGTVHQTKQDADKAEKHEP